MAQQVKFQRALSKIRKICTGPTYNLFQIDYKIIFTKFGLTQWIPKLPGTELWNSLSEAVSDNFHGSGGHDKRNYLQDRAHFHRSWTWQIVLIFNTELDSTQGPDQYGILRTMLPTGNWLKYFHSNFTQVCSRVQWPLLLTWFNFNPTMDK